MPVNLNIRDPVFFQDREKNCDIFLFIAAVSAILIWVLRGIPTEVNRGGNSISTFLFLEVLFSLPHSFPIYLT